MSSLEAIEITDDDESFEALDEVNKSNNIGSKTTCNISSDEDDYGLPDVNIQTRRNVIKNLFPTLKNYVPKTKSDELKPKPHLHHEPCKEKFVSTPKEPGIERMIVGVKVNLPVNPYPSQMALMSTVIKAITKSQNCLLESPTGSGKTLALLCAALAVQRHEKNQISEKQAQNYFSNYSELNKLQNAAEFIASPKKSAVDNAENFFTKFAYTKTIYNGASENRGNTSSKRQEPLSDSSEDSASGLVTLHHKKPRLDGGSGDATPHPPSTPDKKIPVPEAETPEDVRKLYALVDNLRVRTSMVVASRLPTIYYGARTHKQIEQVVKEFARTVYAGQAPMTVLSSREYSCIREYDRAQWASKNDMCRGCVKTYESKRKDSSNCTYYNNRKALSHKTLPPVFDLEDLVSEGRERQACPYYAAREMAATANIVFCPYNYLIEPSIRNNMQIDLRDNIVIIDEGHNIEDVCRDAATFTITRAQVAAAILELQKVAQYTYANQDSMGYIDHLLKVLNSWEQWFLNQTPLINNQPVNNNEAVYTWAVGNFVNTLNNHNIGQNHYSEFRDHAEAFCRRLREDPRTLLGATQATGSLVESIDTVLGYLFREGGRYMDDFVPALVRTTLDDHDDTSWRNSTFNRSTEKESLALRLLCMNPAIVFEALKPARCIIIASGTLTPLISLHSELGTEFPLQVRPKHIIAKDRVWIGTLSTCPDGSMLQCRNKETQQVHTQDALGETVLHVCRATPAGVLCFLPSYGLMYTLIKRWRETNVWKKLQTLKHVFNENRNVRDHNDIMEQYYERSASGRGALLLAVYRGKVSEGMDFKDHQARAVITIGIPYPNTFDMAVREKMAYNDKYRESRKLLPGHEWLRVQAYRALNQAVGRCVRHRLDWGAVLLVDARFQDSRNTEHLSKWVRDYLSNNHHTFASLLNSPTSLESFMQHMKIQEYEEDT